MLGVIDTSRRLPVHANSLFVAKAHRRLKKVMQVVFSTLFHGIRGRGNGSSEAQSLHILML